MRVCVGSSFNVETHYEGLCQVRFQRGNSLGASVSVPASAWQPSKRFCVGSGFNVETRYEGLYWIQFQRGNPICGSVSVPVST